MFLVVYPLCQGKLLQKIHVGLRGAIPGLEGVVDTNLYSLKHH